MVFTQKATLQALMYCAAVFAARTLPTQSDPGGFAARVLMRTDRDLLLCQEVMMFEMLLRHNF